MSKPKPIAKSAASAFTGQKLDWLHHQVSGVLDAMLASREARRERHLRWKPAKPVIVKRSEIGHE